MERKKGFISITALIIMSVVLSMVLYLGYLSNLEYSILNSNKYKTQSYYQSEGKIYLALYDDKYYLNQLYLNILDVFRTNNFGTLSKSIRIEDLDLNFGDDIKDIWLKFLDKDNRINMDIIAHSNINGVKSKLTSSGTIVNQLFETEYPILSPNLIDEKYKEEFIELMRTIDENINIDNYHRPESMFGMESNNFNRIILKRKDNNNYEIASIRQNMLNPYIENFNKKEVFIVAKSMENEELEFYIGDPENSLATIDLSGVIFVEGNIIISDNFQFKGIIIVKNGEIITNSTKEPKIYGLVIIDDKEGYDDFIKEDNIIRSRHTIYKYGTYLPGFFDPKLTVIKGI